MANRRRAAFADIHIGFRNKAIRGLWGLAHTLLFRPSPRLAHGWRRMLLRLFGAQVAADARVYPTAQIWAPWNLVLDAGSTLGDDVYCYNVARVHLGPGATVSQLAVLCAASRDIDRPGRPVIAAPIRIGAGAWVAIDSFIGPGVSIGDNAVVGARSVVTHDIPANHVVAGAPPRLLRVL
jgi:putative colanic acid biosynthesis acetyltransferase WcaF